MRVQSHGLRLNQLRDHMVNTDNSRPMNSILIVQAPCRSPRMGPFPASRPLMCATSNSLLRLLVAALLCFGSSHAWAAAPKAPTIKTVNESGQALTNAQMVTTLPTGARGFLVRWTDNSSDEDFFVVYYRKGTSGTFYRYGLEKSNSTYSKIILPATLTFTAGTVFQFAVVACKGVYNEERRLLLEDGTAIPAGFVTTGFPKVSEQSALSSPMTATWPSTGTAFVAPTNFVAAPVAGTDGMVSFTFDDNSTTENGFIVHGKPSSLADSYTDSTGAIVSNWQALKSHTGTNYDDSDFPFNKTNNTGRLSLTPGVSYDFRIRAVRTVAAGGSLEATDWSATSTMIMPSLSEATQLVYETPAENIISFSWTDRSENEQGYLLENKKASSSSWSTYQTLNANVGTTTVYPFEDPGVAYNWRVSAASETGNTTSSSVPLTNCVLNALASSAGSTSVTCASTANLTVGDYVSGPSASITGTFSKDLPSVSATTTAALMAGMTVQGTGIPTGTRILSIDSATAFTMTANASADGTSVTIEAGPPQVLGNTTSGSATVTTTETSFLAVGMYVQGTGIPTGARVTSIASGASFVMSSNATATSTTAVTISANLFAANTQVSSIPSLTTFIVTAPAFLNTTSTPFGVTATTVTNVLARGSSNVVTVTTAFNAPSNLTATLDNDATAAQSLVKLSWTDNSNSENGFEIRYRLAVDPDVESSYQRAAVINGNTAAAPVSLSYTLTSGLPQGKQLKVQIRALVANSSGNILASSAPSNSIDVTTKDGFTGELFAPITKDQSFTYTIETTNNTAITSLTATDLPPGVSLDSNTRVVSGTPTKSGLFLCPMKVTFTGGNTATETLQLRVLEPKAAPVALLPSNEARTIKKSSSSEANVLTIPLNQIFSDPDTEQAVRFNVKVGTAAAKSVDVILYKTLTPQTVSNFMNYVLSNDYENVVFHRRAGAQFLQGGNFKYIPNLSSSTSTLFTTVLSRTSPLNEPGISNVKGTIAMAKVAGNPNSATHDFFFNLADNTEPYNPAKPDGDQSVNHQNGGFTVFGRIADNSSNPSVTTNQRLIDSITALNITSAQSGYDSNGNPIYDTASPPARLPDLRSSVNVRDPRGGTTKVSKITDFPVVNSATPAPHVIIPSDLVVISSITPITELLTYSNLTSSAPANVEAEIANGALKLKGLNIGSSVVELTATDLDGMATTQKISVTVSATYEPPVITSHPVNVSVAESGSATLSVTATGDDLTYQWKKNGEAIAVVSTVAPYSLASAQLADSGDYTVLVSNKTTSILSNVARVRVNKVPVITTQPVAVTVTYPASTVLSVEASGTPPLRYIWAPPASAADANKKFLGAPSIIIPAKKVNNGNWSVTATNAPEVGTETGTGSVVSNIVAVTVIVPDSDGDGVDDEDEDIATTNKFLADTDGDGYSDGVEKALGTNAKSAASTPGSKFFVAERDYAATLKSVLMKRVVNNTAPSNAEWFGATEVTNKQFASMLQYGMNEMKKITVVVASTRVGVYYGTDLSNPICYLSAPTDTSGSASTDISFTKADGSTTYTTGSFTVPAALANAPVRLVSWVGAYFAATAMNEFHGFTSKSISGTDFASSSTPGYRIPTDDQWSFVAKNNLPGTPIYPTGNTLSASQAWFGQNLETGRPKNVGSYSAKNYGCSDLAGNVAEWVFDGPGSTGIVANVRGGSYADFLANTESTLLNAKRKQYDRNSLQKDVGIRLALDAPATPTITLTPPVYAPAPSGGGTPVPPFYMLLRTDEALKIDATVTGAPALTHQWLRNGSVVAGQTEAKLNIAPLKLTSAGSYQLRVTSNGDTLGTAASGITKVSIVQLPTTRSFTLATNKSATLTVPYTAATGETLTFAWFKGTTRLANRGSYLAGVDTNSLAIKSCQPADTSTYVCEIRDTRGSPTVTVSFDLIVSDQPQVDAPVFTEPTMVGESFSYTVYHPLLTNADVSTQGTKYTASGLPSGLTINSTTGVISGKPRVSGTFTVVITTTNPTGSTSTSSVTLVVKSMDEMLQGNAVGSFFGLIGRHTGQIAQDLRLTNAQGINDDLGGRIDFTVTKSATLTGRLTLGSAVHSFSGTLDTVYNPTTPVAPTANILIPRKGKTPIGLVLTMSVSSSPTFNGTLYELLADGSSTGRFTGCQGWRNIWSKAPASQASNYDGKHNILLRISSGFIGDAKVPQGTGYATINVSVAGATSLVGKLPDGTAISFSSFLGPDGQQPLYQVLYGGKGSVLGWTVEGSDVQHTFSGTDAFSWLKKPQPEASKDRLYKLSGIDTSLTAVGGLYNPPVPGNMVMLLSGAVSPNAQLNFGTSPSLFTQDLNVIAPATTSFVGLTVSNSTTCRITASSGVFTGTFKLPDGRTATYQGLIVPDPDRPLGYGLGEGYFNLNTDTTTTSPTLSQRVTLKAKP